MDKQFFTQPISRRKALMTLGAAGLVAAGEALLPKAVNAEVPSDPQAAAVVSSTQAFGVNVRDFISEADWNIRSTAAGIEAVTAGIKKAFNASKGRVFFPAGEYKINDTITIESYHFVEGESRGALRTLPGAAVTIEQTNKDKYCFEFISAKSSDGKPYDISCGIGFRHLLIIAKNGIKINTTEDFRARGNIKGAIFDNVRLDGNYNSNFPGGPPNPDPFYGTAEEAKTTDLETNYGVGIYVAKGFNFSIRDCQIQKYGVGISLYGTDISLIDNCRIAECARHVSVTLIKDVQSEEWGGQVKIMNCDLLLNKRVGAIFIDGAKWTHIENNYFECYSNAANFIITQRDWGTLIAGNRFDNPNGNKSESEPKISTPFMKLSPAFSTIVTHNRWNKQLCKTNSLPVITTENWATADLNIASGQTLAIWKDNAPEFPSPVPELYPNSLPDVPAVQTRDYDPYLFTYNNFQLTQKSEMFTSKKFPWVVQKDSNGIAFDRYTLINDYVGTGGSKVARFSVPLMDLSCKKFIFSITGRKVADDNAEVGYGSIYYLVNGKKEELLQEPKFKFTKGNEFETKHFKLKELPNLGLKSIECEIVVSDVHYSMFRITPVDHLAAFALIPW